MSMVTDRDIVVGLERRRRKLWDRRHGEWTPRPGPEFVEGRPFDVFKARELTQEERMGEAARLLLEALEVEGRIPSAAAAFAAWLKSDKRKGNPIDPEHLRRLAARLRHLSEVMWP